MVEGGQHCVGGRSAMTAADSVNAICTLRIELGGSDPLI
jgi:hypothetical protein